MLFLLAGVYAHTLGARFLVSVNQMNSITHFSRNEEPAWRFAQSPKDNNAEVSSKQWPVHATLKKCSCQFLDGSLSAALALLTQTCR